MWCSSSTFTSAISIGSIPTGLTSLAPADLTTIRTTQQMLLLPRPPLSQTSQRRRRRMIKKKDCTLICLPGPQCWGEEDLWKLGRERSCRLAVMDAATKKMQFNCSLWFLCGSTENHIHCRLGKFLFLFPTHPRPLVLRFKWSKTKRDVLYSVWFFRG